MRKKFVKLLGILSIVCVLAVPLYFVMADQNTTFSVEVKKENNVDGENITTAKQGEHIYLFLKMAGNKGLNGLNLSVNINKDAFKIIDVTAPEDMNFLKTFGAAVHDKSDDGSKALVALAYVGKSSGPKTSDYNGPIMVVELEVLNAAAGDYNFDIEVEKYTKNETGNLEDYEDVPYNSPAPGTIKIENPATDITVGDATVNMIYGNNYQIPINAVTENGGTTTTEKNLSFNVTQGSDIIDVSSEGLVTANKNKNGEAKVTVNAYGFTKEITINVSNPIKEIKLSKQDVTLEIKKMQGGSETKGSELITAELIAENPDGPISDDQTISWESNKGDVASVSGGTISAVGGGVATITAKTTKDISASVNVTVNIPITSASISESGPITLNRGGTKDLQVTYYPLDTTDSTKIDWNSTVDSVATVNDGHIVAVSGGKTKITANLGTYHFEVDVTVFVDIDSLDITDSDMELLPTQSKKLNLVINPADTSEKDKIKWESSEEGTVSVDQDGTIHAIKPGTVTITVKYNDKQDQITVKVLKPIDSVTIQPSAEFTMNKGEEQQLSVKIEPDDAEEDRTVTWESDNTKVVTVEADGKVHAVGGGTANVTGTLKNGKSVKATITVKVPVSSVVIEDGKDTIEIERGSKKTLKIKINPDDFTDKNNTVWQSSEDGIAEVDGNGVVTAKAIGTTVITAIRDGKQDTITIKVVAPIKDVKINEKAGLTKDYIELVKNNTTNLTATVNPSDTTEKYTLEWSSSDDEIATVSPTGVVTARKAGTVTIKVKANNHEDTIKIKVIVPITSFEVRDKNMTIIKGKKNAVKVSPAINPSDTTESKTITWKSDDESIATVDKDGLITGLKEGTTIITGSLSNGMEVKINVTVKIIPLDDISVSYPNDLLKGSSGQILITPDPIDSTELENVVYSSSDDDIVSVDELGILTAKKAGKATITIKVGNITKEINIEIKEIKSEKIIVSVEKDNLNIGDEEKINIEILPNNTTDELTFTYESSDENILTVDEFGKIKAVGSGSAKIKVTASNGLKSEIEIEVNEVVSNVTTKEDTINPQTGMEANIKNLIISLSSLGLFGIFGYKRYRLEKNN